MGLKKEKPKTVREWEVVCYTLENDLRSTQLSGGFSSAQRAWGRGVSTWKEVHERSPAELSGSDVECVERVLELQRLAREVHFEARSGRAAKRILLERERKEPHVYEVGEIVYYRKPEGQGSASGAWMGPAVVSARTEHPDSSGVKYHLDHGGVLVCRGRRDIRGALENEVGGARRGMQAEEVPEPGDTKEEEPGDAEDKARKTKQEDEEKGKPSAKSELKESEEAERLQKDVEERLEERRREVGEDLRRETEEKRPRGRPRIYGKETTREEKRVLRKERMEKEQEEEEKKKADTKKEQEAVASFLHKNVKKAVGLLSKNGLRVEKPYNYCVFLTLGRKTTFLAKACPQCHPP